MDNFADLIPPLEKKLGPIWSRILWVLVFLAAFVALARSIWENLAFLLRSIKEVSEDVEVGWTGFITIDNIAPLFETLFLAVGFIVIGFVAFLLRPRLRQVSQKHIDALAELRSDGIHTVLNFFPKSDAELLEWKQVREDWRKNVISHLLWYFTNADRLGFEQLGVIVNTSFSFAYNDEHIHLLNMLTKELAILEYLIDRYSR